MAGDRRRRRHLRRHQVGAPALALASLKVPIGSAGTALLGLEYIGVHAQAHAASRFAPFKAGVGEDAIQAERILLDRAVNAFEPTAL
jgi:hypothetical protein